DDQLFRKTQFGLQGGLSLRLFNKSGHPLEIGPQFGYKFSNLLKSGETKHLLNGTIGVRWTIRK
ncbi:MAG: hypothetical protein H7Y31_16970, partial [Chitinophagaceae bacterium]|nr:hypothetical protein [Chitinophagaceae bacterium]